MPCAEDGDRAKYRGRTVRAVLAGGSACGEKFAEGAVFFPGVHALARFTSFERRMRSGTGFAHGQGEPGGLDRCDALNGWSSLPQHSLHYSRCKVARP